MDAWAFPLTHRKAGPAIRGTFNGCGTPHRSPIAPDLPISFNHREPTMYGFKTTLAPTSFDDALARTVAALKVEGFGVLSEIDVQHAMKEKLGVDMLPHRILGACNPTLAHQALQAEPDIGLLLPCNVVVRAESADRVVVGFLDPQVMVGLVSKPGMKAVADAAEQRLRRVCDSLGGSAVQAV